MLFRSNIDLDRIFLVSLQFCSNVPEVFTEAALLAEPYCDAVDLNLGCPQIIAKRGIHFNELFIMAQLIQESSDFC